MNSHDFGEIHVEATIPCLCCCFVLLRVCIVLLHVVDIIVVISGIVKDLNNTYLVYRNWFRLDWGIICFAYVNHARTRSWNQLVLSNACYDFRPKKQRASTIFSIQSKCISPNTDCKFPNVPTYEFC